MHVLKLWLWQLSCLCCGTVGALVCVLPGQLNIHRPFLSGQKEYLVSNVAKCVCHADQIHMGACRFTYFGWDTKARHFPADLFISYMTYLGSLCIWGDLFIPTKDKHNDVALCAVHCCICFALSDKQMFTLSDYSIASFEFSVPEMTHLITSFLLKLSRLSDVFQMMWGTSVCRRHDDRSPGHSRILCGAPQVLQRGLVSKRVGNLFQI